jgi:hypothetical protein
MLRPSLVRSVLAAVACVLTPSAQRGDERVRWTSDFDPVLELAGLPSPDGVTGKATVVIEREPATMRLQVTVLGAGKTAKDALDALRTRADKTKHHVLALGADPASIVVGSAVLHALPDPYPTIMTRLLRAPAKDAARGAVRVEATFTADWPLPRKPREEVLAAVHALQQELLALDLSGAAEARKLTPAEEKALTDAGVETGAFSEEGLGEPAFEFRAELPAELLARARAEAFRRATANARLLAAAAGRELGELRGVGDDNDPAPPAVLPAAAAGEPGERRAPPGADVVHLANNSPATLVHHVVLEVRYGFAARPEPR